MKIVILGAGGQARECRWYLEDIGGYEFVGYVVSDPSRLGPTDSKDEVIGGTAWLLANRDRFDGLVIGIGTPKYRLKVARELLPEFPEDRWPALVHPSAVVARGAKIGAGVLVGPRAVVSVGVELRAFSMLNYGVTVGHETIVGEGCVINPNASLSGGVTLGEGVLVGTGAQILQYHAVGARTIVGAGALVTRDLPPDVTAVGVPARAKA